MKFESVVEPASFGGTFTQTYEGSEVDASLLQLPQTGFIAYDDPAMLGTVAVIEADLQGPNGLLHRYRTESGKDGLAGDEYAFLLCSFWLVEQYAHCGRRDDAERLHVAPEQVDLGRRQLAPVHPGCPCPLQQRVVHVRRVLHVVHIVAGIQPESDEGVERQVGRGVADVQVEGFGLRQGPGDHVDRVATSRQPLVAIGASNLSLIHL